LAAGKDWLFQRAQFATAEVSQLIQYTAELPTWFGLTQVSIVHVGGKVKEAALKKKLVDSGKNFHEAGCAGQALVATRSATRGSLASCGASKPPVVSNSPLSQLLGKEGVATAPLLQGSASASPPWSANASP
jgi:hypothetical protein